MHSINTLPQQIMQPANENSNPFLLRALDNLIGWDPEKGVTLTVFIRFVLSSLWISLILLLLTSNGPQSNQFRLALLALLKRPQQTWQLLRNGLQIQNKYDRLLEIPFLMFFHYRIIRECAVANLESSYRQVSPSKLHRITMALDAYELQLKSNRDQIRLALYNMRMIFYRQQLGTFIGLDLYSKPMLVLQVKQVLRMAKSVMHQNQFITTISQLELNNNKNWFQSDQIWPAWIHKKRSQQWMESPSGDSEKSLYLEEFMSAVQSKQTVLRQLLL